MRANFDNALELLAFEMDSQRFRPGDDIHLALQRQALIHLEKDYHAFMHLLGDRIRVVADHDKASLNNLSWPTDWQAGEPLRDEYLLSLPQSLSVGTCMLELGLYSFSDLQRLPVVGADQSQPDRVLLPPIVLRR